MQHPNECDHTELKANDEGVPAVLDFEVATRTFGPGFARFHGE